MFMTGDKWAKWKEKVSPARVEQEIFWFAAIPEDIFIFIGAELTQGAAWMEKVLIVRM